MRNQDTGICSECESPPEAHHLESCSQFLGYYCMMHNVIYFESCHKCSKLLKDNKIG